MKPNPKAIAALKRVMTKEQRQLFVDNCISFNGKNFLDGCDYETVIDCGVGINQLRNVCKSFNWYNSKQGLTYWDKIFSDLTKKEKALKLFIK